MLGWGGGHPSQLLMNGEVQTNAADLLFSGHKKLGWSPVSIPTFYERRGTEQEAHRPKRSPEYQRLYTEFLSEGCIFAYQQPHYYNKIQNKQLYRKAASLSFNTIAINVKYIDREEENTYSL